MNFTDLSLREPILRAIQEVGYTTPTSIQQQAIPYALKGKDILGCAQTGTGKTAAFAIPILQRMSEMESLAGGIVTLVLTPTRELAIQVHQSFLDYGKHLPYTAVVVFGGVNQYSQVQALRQKPGILVATPGRLLDLMGQGLIRLDQVRFFVLDEADRMLDMGFIHDVKRIVKQLPQPRQSLFFSATMPVQVQELAYTILTKPEFVEVVPQSTPVERIKQQVFHVARLEKRGLLKSLIVDHGIDRAIVFTRTKHGADRVTRDLVRCGFKAAAIHGDKSQAARQQALEGFRQGTLRILVATDIAARGLDIDGVTHIINYDLPNEAETYVHRIGRTARAGASGEALSFCDPEETDLLENIERITRIRIPMGKVNIREEYEKDSIVVPSTEDGQQRGPRSGGTRRNSRGRSGNTSSRSSSSPQQPAKDPSDRKPRNNRRKRRPSGNA